MSPLTRNTSLYPVGRDSQPSYTTYKETVLLDGSRVTAGYEPLVIQFVGPRFNGYWLVQHAAVVGFASLVPPLLPQSGEPATGWYMTQEGAPNESLADAQIATALGGINLRARGLPLTTTIRQTPLAGGGYFYSAIADLKRPVLLRAGETLRFLMNINPGTAQPGPGAGSSASAWMQVLAVEL